MRRSTGKCESVQVPARAMTLINASPLFVLRASLHLSKIAPSDLVGPDWRLPLRILRLFRRSGSETRLGRQIIRLPFCITQECS